MNTSNPITIGYWSTKGLGSVCRQVVIYAEEKLISKNYKLQPIIENDNVSFDGSDWTNKDKIELKKRNSLINLPYMEIIDKGQKHLISQSNACLLYLGRKFKMLGSNEVEQTRCEQLLLETNDLRGIITSFAYTHFKNKDVEKEAAKEVYEKAFQVFVSLCWTSLLCMTWASFFNFNLIKLIYTYIDKAFTTCIDSSNWL